MKSRLLAMSFLFAFLATINAQTGLVDEVRIQGIKKLKFQAVKKLLATESGQPLDSTLIANDINRLKRLPSVANAEFQVEATVETNFIVTYSIEENFTLIPFANLFTSNNDKFAFILGLQEYNLFGQNITLGGYYQHDIFNSFGINLRAPYLFSDQFGLAFIYNNFTTQEPVFLDNGTADYRYNNEGFELLGLYQLNLTNNFELGFSLFTEDYQYLFGEVDPQVPQNLNVDKYLFKLIYDYNNISYFYQYLSGFRSRLNFQYVLSSDESLPEFLIGFNDFFYFKRIGKRGNWANRLRLGLASNVDSPFAPFSVDNNLNIRGVGNTIDRGTGAIVLNTEYRYSLIDKDWFVLQGNVFIDGGTWRNPGGDFGDFGDSQNIRIYPGFGLRFIHKRIFNAVFRIDFGKGITRDGSQGLVFGIGQYF